MRDPLRRLVDRLARRIAYEVRNDRRRYGETREQYLAIASLRERYHDDGLSAAELRVFSQNGEDGVLAEIFSRIGVEARFFVEFGVGERCGVQHPVSGRGARLVGRLLRMRSPRLRHPVVGVWTIVPTSRLRNAW